MNEEEKVTVEQPETTETSIDKSPFAEIDNEVISENANAEEESENGKPTEKEETSEQEIDYTPFLKEISEKAKYNKEHVQVDSMDEVITNFQKGLNYDKLVEQKKALENSKVFSYVSKKANELGMTVDEYMDSVEKYEQEQEQIRQQQQIDEMVENGVPEEVAKEVVATSQLRKQLQEEKNQLEEEKRKKASEEAKDKEFLEFLEAFPDVKAEDIPKEVFLNAQKSSLKQAYLEYQNSEYKKQLEILKTNQKNEQKSIGSVTDTGVNEQEGSDPFLEGFNSV